MNCCNTPWDVFLHYDPKGNRLIMVTRDIKWGDEPWRYFHFDGTKCWWTKGFLKPEHWVLIDRLPEGSL